MQFMVYHSQNNVEVIFGTGNLKLTAENFFREVLQVLGDNQKLSITISGLYQIEKEDLAVFPQIADQLLALRGNKIEITLIQDTFRTDIMQYFGCLESNINVSIKLEISNYNPEHLESLKSLLPITTSLFLRLLSFKNLEQVKNLLASLSRVETLKELSIIPEDNEHNIDFKIYGQDIVEALKNMPKLKTLTLYRITNLDEITGKSLGESLTPSLETLVLHECGIDDTSLSAILTNLDSHCHLKRLDLSENKITEPYAALCKTPHLESLQVLTLEYNPIPTSSLARLATLLCSNDSKIQSLKLLNQNPDTEIDTNLQKALENLVECTKIMELSIPGYHALRYWTPEGNVVLYNSHPTPLACCY